jgi:multidrug efflux pump subunit AcrB
LAVSSNGYQVIVDPQKLQAYGISLVTVSQAILNTIDRGDTTPPPRATCISLSAVMLYVRRYGAFSA